MAICKTATCAPMSMFQSVCRANTKNTMKCAQELYENGLITYMRTDSSCYSKDFITLLKQHIGSTYGTTYVNENITNLTVNSRKGKTQDAHEGIRVCDLSITDSSLPNSSSNRLYKLIYKHTVQCGMSKSHGVNHDYFIIHDTEHLFKYTDKFVSFDGWKILDNIQSTISYKNYLDILIENNQIFDMNYLEAVEKLINSISHLNESSLVQQLESMNIGRPSTFSSIVQGLQDRKYVKRQNIDGIKITVKNYIVKPSKSVEIEEIEKSLNSEKSKLIITPIGRQVSEFCKQHFSEIFDYNFTNHMEEMLDDIEHKSFNSNTILNNYISQIDCLIDKTYAFLDKNPDNINKVKDVSLYCGEVKGVVSYIKSGKYGYYLNRGDDKISLNDFNDFDICHKIDKSISVTDEEKDMLSDYLSIRSEKRTSNMLVILSKDCSIRQSKHGTYIYYKTKKMKQPRFMKYNDENDNKIAIRDEWVQTVDKSSIRKYIIQKYNINI